MKRIEPTELEFCRLPLFAYDVDPLEEGVVDQVHVREVDDYGSDLRRHVVGVFVIEIEKKPERFGFYSIALCDASNHESQAEPLPRA
ncbi:MAG: hypothetical protein IPM54_07400 [Polyangiaceae bacterium]|nr:hypothetical protein [Polyangiaceae bacterium]